MAVALERSQHLATASHVDSCVLLESFEVGAGPPGDSVGDDRAGRGADAVERRERSCGDTSHQLVIGQPLDDHGGTLERTDLLSWCQGAVEQPDRLGQSGRCAGSWGARSGSHLGIVAVPHSGGWVSDDAPQVMRDWSAAIALRLHGAVRESLATADR